jgi:LPXTG-site transpeptidase (sortase) family protein
MHSPEGKSKSLREKISSLLLRAGCLLLLVAGIVLLWNFAPVIKLELDYQLTSLKQTLHLATDNQDQVPDFTGLIADSTGSSDNTTGNTDNRDFYIIIPKIQADARIIPNVDPYDIVAYAKALAFGIAHAAGTALPGQNGNTFLFAHSGRNFYDSSGQNVQFYLLDKLAIGDRIYIHYLGTVYTYEVFETKRVWPNEIQYLTNQNFDYNQLTLSSCWPAGVNYQRQLVLAKLLDTSK